MEIVKLIVLFAAVGVVTVAAVKFVDKGTKVL